MRPLLLCLLAALLSLGSARADEPFFKKNDVIALVGGEDMVVASEYGYLEALITRALPDYHLRFRSLAWEGDTVFEQRRDLNFPTWEEQLDKIGATVVICQFGQMESLEGPAKTADFIDAYGKLVDRFSAGGKRRVILFSPFVFAINVHPHAPDFDQAVRLIKQNETVHLYAKTIEEMAAAHHANFVDAHEPSGDDTVRRTQRDYSHLDELGHRAFAYRVQILFEANFALPHDTAYDGAKNTGDLAGREMNQREREQPLLGLIRAKNKLWFDYWRVQNWAFLAGDRTNQPSSRDHRDPSKRWFPAEREEFIPLIEAKEKEIDALVRK